MADFLTEDEINNLIIQDKNKINTKTIKICLISAINPIILENVVKNYPDDVLYNVYLDTDTIKRYPLCNIYEIEEYSQC
jgi:hypothetical protein